MATPPQNISQDVVAESASSAENAKTDVLNPFPPVEAIILDFDEVSKTQSTSQSTSGRDCPGERLPSFSFTARPTAAPARQVRLTANETTTKPATDPASTVFLPDERYIYTDNNFPWSLVGKVRTANGWGSGTVVGPRHVLTASHVVNWTRDANGNIGWSSFTPAYFDGRGPWGEFSVRQVYAWRENNTPTLTNEQSAFDYAILVLHNTISDKVGGFAGARVYDASWNEKALWQVLGYPADLNGGERPAFQANCVVSSRQDYNWDNKTGSVLGHFNDIFGGQSGGPAWGTWAGETWPRVVGVQSTESFTPQLGSTSGDNQFGGGPAMFSLVDWVKTNVP